MKSCSILASVFFHATSASSNVQRCSVPSGKSGKVLSFSDGTNERCVAVVAPSSSSTSLPILFWFHGSGGSAADCGMDGPNAELAQLSVEQGFALVCAEALQSTSRTQSGLWDIPQVQTNSTGTPCKDSDSIEIGYIKNAILELAKAHDGLPTMDATRVFTSGCSMGSAFSEYTASCLKARNPSVLSAFATHSTGLKTKGDGAILPPDNTGKYTWGECPTCQYWPFVPTAFTDSLGLKACVFDNTGDGDFYKTSKSLVTEWAELGMKAESHFGSGGHCQIHSYAAIVNCLDDGTKRLLAKGPAPSPSPSPPSPPSPSPDVPSTDCQACFNEKCGGTPKKTDMCRGCVVDSQCEPRCGSYSLSKGAEWFCDSAEVTLV